MHADNTTVSLTVLTEGAGNVVQCLFLTLFLYSPYIKKGLEQYAISLKTMFSPHVAVLEFKQSDRKWLATVVMQNNMLILYQNLSGI
jgi:hypothetical protein